MQIDFDSMVMSSVPNFKGGEGVLDSKMFTDGRVRILTACLKPGSSIGNHAHEDGHEVMFFISGEGVAMCDGEKEVLKAGSVHYCPKGSSHEIVNTGSEDLVMYCVVSYF